MSETGDSQDVDLRIDPKVLTQLVCPLTKTQLILDKDNCELISLAARLAFPIKKSIPLLFVGESRELSDEELDRHRTRTAKQV